MNASLRGAEHESAANKMRTMQINPLQGVLYEYGISFKTGHQAGLAEIRLRLDEVEQAVPGWLFSALQEQLTRIDRLDEEIGRIERRLVGWQKQLQACQKIAAIPGIDMLTGLALGATWVRK
ncbi:hypothetical protein [Cupriavidus sp. UME77]|uniref:hypothetical protein n=1 Tax=Cupriavidus sp. UME77 TaxID=1862321 RepID=UPI001603DB15|nr:hypothetical protein [Cupriavidus sp. UME77]MBB1634900.1 hypothetical protein [Cupriavidus sp. UME77]